MYNEILVLNSYFVKHMIMFKRASRFYFSYAIDIYIIMMITDKNNNNNGYF